LLEQKRTLAAKIVGAGEQWITELDGRELRELFVLSEGAVADGDDEETGPGAAPAPAAKKPRGRLARSTRGSGEVRA
jgi:hypothetical protein